MASYPHNVRRCARLTLYLHILDLDLESIDLLPAQQICSREQYSHLWVLTVGGFFEVSRNPGLHCVPSRHSDLYPGRRPSWSRTLLLSGRRLSRDHLSSMRVYYRMRQSRRLTRLYPPHPWCFSWREHRRHHNAASRELVSRSWACRESTPRSSLRLTSSRMWSCAKVNWQAPFGCLLGRRSTGLTSCVLEITRCQRVLGLADYPAIVPGQGICWWMWYPGVDAPEWGPLEDAWGEGSLGGCRLNQRNEPVFLFRWFGYICVYVWSNVNWIMITLVLFRPFWCWCHLHLISFACLYYTRCPTSAKISEFCNANVVQMYD